MNQSFFCIAVLALSFLSGCHPPDPEPPQAPIEGNYPGETYKVEEVGTEQGVTITDTLFADTFEIMLLPNDSIQFSNRNHIWKFEYDESNEYKYWYGGSDAYQSFRWVAPDSLYARHWSFGGWHPTYYLGTSDFSGKKE